MNGKLVIAVVGALALALAGYILLSDRGPSGTSKAASRPSAGTSASDVARLLPDSSGKAPEVTPEEARAIRAALEKAAGPGGANPKADAPVSWAPPVVEAETRSCQERAQSFVPPRLGGAESVCACAVQAVAEALSPGPAESSEAEGQPRLRARHVQRHRGLRLDTAVSRGPFRPYQQPPTGGTASVQYRVPPWQPTIEVPV